MSNPAFLKKYGRSELYQYERPCIIRLEEVTGSIAFSRTAVYELSLTEGDLLTFATDIREPNLIYFKKGGDGIPLCAYKKNGNKTEYMVKCRSMVRKLLTHLRLKGSHSFYITKATTTIDSEQWWLINKSKKR